MRKNWFVRLAGILFVMLLLNPVFALAEETYPDGPITLLVPFSAGGSIDLMCRTIAPYLGAELGTNVVVDNKPGAGSQIGLTYLVKNAKADGYTMSEASQPHSNFSILVQGAPYAVEDFAWIGIQQIDPVAMIVMKEKPWNTLTELFDYIKKHPGEVAIGCTQMSGPHVVMLSWQKDYGLDFTIVPYPGGGAGRAALIGGHVDAYFGFAMANYSMNDVGKCIGVGSEKRTELWPKAPTFSELFPNDTDHTDFVNRMASYRGFVFPASLRDKYPERFAKISKAIKTVMQNDKYLAECQKTGQKAIMTWIDSEPAEAMVKKSYNLLSNYTSYFKK